MSQLLELKIGGLWTNPNGLSEVPPGTMSIAQNVVVDRESIVESRRGFKQYGISLDESDIKSMYVFDDKLIVLTESNDLYYDSDGAGTWVRYEGDYPPPDSMTTPKSFQSNKNFYFTTNNGLQKLTAINDTPYQAGVPKALSGVGSLANDAERYYNAILSGINRVIESPSGQTSLALNDSVGYNASYTGSWGVTGSRTLSCIHTVTFDSADHARHFFNAGGKIKFSYERTGGSTTTKNTEVSQMASDLGVMMFNSKGPVVKAGGNGSSATLANKGYFDLLDTDQQYLIQYDGMGAYSSNYIQMLAKWSGTEANGAKPVITFTTKWYVASWTYDDSLAVDGTTTTRLIVSSPSTTYLTNTWGTPAVNTSTTITG